MRLAHLAVPTSTPWPHGSQDSSLCDVEMVFKVGREREKPGMAKITLTNPLGERPVCPIAARPARLGFLQHWNKSLCFGLSSR